MSVQWAVPRGRYKNYQFSPEVREEIRKLNKLDNWHGPCAFVVDALWIGLAIWLCYEVSFWFYPVALVVIGSRMRGLANLLHASAHNILTANRALSMALGTVFTAYPIFQTHYTYKKTHVATHHPKLGRPDADPDLMYFISQGVYAEGLTERQRFIRLVVLPALGVKTIPYLIYLITNRLGGARTPEAEVDGSAQFRAKARWDGIGFLAFWVVALAGLAWGGLLTAFVLFWLVPFATTFQILGWYIELAEHTPLVRDHNVSLYMTRNRKSRGLEKFLTAIHRENYHLEHHLDPRTPFWNMRRAHLQRMRDPEYARWDAQAGGLFHKGPQGQPSAIRAIIHGLGNPPDREDATAGRGGPAVAAEGDAAVPADA